MASWGRGSPRKEFQLKLGKWAGRLLAELGTGFPARLGVVAAVLAGGPFLGYNGGPLP